MGEVVKLARKMEMPNDGLEHNPTALERAAEQPLPNADTLANEFEVLQHPAPATQTQWQEAMEKLQFGTSFSDHMATAHWNPQQGWHDKQIRAFAPLEISPACSVLHYSQTIFEGMKAYRHADGSIWAFRPGYNAARFAYSAQRLAMPTLPVSDFLASLVQTVRLDARWVPQQRGASLYLRPLMFASQAFLGVHPAQEITYLMMASPVGSYFASGLAPVSIWVAQDYHRAGPGGTGDAKTGGNYAASLLPQIRASKAGFDQVCYLDAQTNKNLEELGGMNVFAVRRDGALITPKLTGTILEGGTRSAIARMCRDEGRPVFEQTVALSRLLEGIDSGEITEMFACGTAAVVVPIGRLAGDGFDVTLPGSSVAQRIYDRLTGIQQGRGKDPYGWMYRLA